MDVKEFVGYALNKGLSYNKALLEAKNLGIRFIRKEKYLIAKKEFEGKKLTKKQEKKIKEYKNEIKEYIKEAKKFKEIENIEAVETVEMEAVSEYLTILIIIRSEGYSDLDLKINIDMGYFYGYDMDIIKEKIEYCIMEIISGLVGLFGNDLGFTGGMEIREKNNKKDNYTKININLDRSKELKKEIYDIVEDAIYQLEGLKVK